jgi:hypothetical protein
LAALNTKDGEGIKSASIEDRKDIFGTNGKEVDEEAIDIKFQPEFWILLFFALL